MKFTLRILTGESQFKGMGAKGAKCERETGEGVMKVIHCSRKGVGTQEMRNERQGDEGMRDEGKMKPRKF